MSSSAGSTMPSGSAPSRGRRSSRTARPEQIGDGIARLLDGRAARRRRADRRPGRGRAARPRGDGDPADVELVVVLGGDGTMLRALRAFLGTGVPVIGVNFGRVGFLSSMQPDELEVGLGACVPRRVRGRSSCRRSRSRTGRDATRRRQRRRRHERRARPHGRARVGGRRRGPRPRPVRRDHLLDARPARPRTTSRTAGPVLMWGIDAIATDVRRAALAPRAAARRPARARTSSSGTGPPTCRWPCSSTGTGSADGTRRAAGSPCAWATRARSSRPCRTRPSCSRYRESFST